MIRHMIRHYAYYMYEDNGFKCVAAVTKFCGKTVKGVAKCDPKDTYDEAIGKRIAELKCEAKIQERRVKYFMSLYKKFDAIASNARSKALEYRTRAQEAVDAESATVMQMVDLESEICEK